MPAAPEAQLTCLEKVGEVGPKKVQVAAGQQEWVVPAELDELEGQHGLWKCSDGILGEEVLADASASTAAASPESTGSVRPGGLRPGLQGLSRPQDTLGRRVWRHKRGLSAPSSSPVSGHRPTPWVQRRRLFLRGWLQAPSRNSSLGKESLRLPSPW